MGADSKLKFIVDEFKKHARQPKTSDLLVVSCHPFVGITSVLGVLDHEAAVLCNLKAAHAAHQLCALKNIRKCYLFQLFNSKPSY